MANKSRPPRTAKNDNIHHRVHREHRAGEGIQTTKKGRRRLQSQGLSTMVQVPPPRVKFSVFLLFFAVSSPFEFLPL
jgi:hypothetical protein